MKKSVVNAAMLLALGVSGAANAVQMHGVIEGTLTSFSDNGADKAWGVLLPGAPLPDAVHIDFWFDSSVTGWSIEGRLTSLEASSYNPTCSICRIKQTSGSVRLGRAESRWRATPLARVLRLLFVFSSG
jgi:hypothetical protein